MGVTESKLASHGQQQQPSPSSDGITTVANRTLETDPLLEKLKALEIATPLLKSPPSEVGLKDLLLRHVHSSEHGALDPTTTASLLTLYHEWQRVTSEKVNKNQEDLSNKIEVVEALAIKLLQRFNSSLRLMKATAMDLEDVHSIKVEVKEMKDRLKDVLVHYNALVTSINEEGPDFLRTDAKPLLVGDFPCSQLQ
ncbi:hypothetical protein GOP47_0029880 [Adiantum capillus-veneris]|nr:hypothetical protein GOP47_0029880 [Adiantum capillus-veneris]